MTFAINRFGMWYAKTIIDSNISYFIQGEITVSFLLNKAIDDSNKRRSTDRGTEVYAPPTASSLNEVIDSSIQKRSIERETEVYVLPTVSSLYELVGSK